MPNPVEVVKRAAVEAVEAQKPVHLLFGQVISASPLKIQVDQKKTLGPAQLILTNNVRDFTVELTVDHKTEITSHGHQVNDTYTGGGSAVSVGHDHAYKGRKSFRVHLGLKQGEKVILVRCDGGQKFFVLDRWEAP